MTTRRDLLLLLRKHPGITVTDLAGRLGLSNMGVRRHLDSLTSEGLVEHVAAPRPPSGRPSVGRPPAGWRLSGKGDEQFPRRYDELAVEVLEGLAATGGPQTVEAVMGRRTEAVSIRYETRMAEAGNLSERVALLAELRDGDGYLAEHEDLGEGAFRLVENNCAIHRVAQAFPVLCAMELGLFRRCLGPGAEVTREAHALAGDAVCSYRVRRTHEDDGRR